jgi:predicted  nucleic acid-binding Zn-ribbon protein
MVMTVGDVNNTPDNSSNAKTFLSDLAPAVDATNIDKMVSDQSDVLTKAQKKYKSLQDDQTSLEKKIRSLQDDLTSNAKAQTSQLQEVQRQQDILTTWKTKKTN